jgi:hypothetical protein
MLLFAGQAKSLGADELLLPIYYVDVAALKPDSADEAMALIARTQYEDWRDLRLADEGASAYRQGVNRLARRLADVVEAMAASPITPMRIAPADDEEPGVVDLLAAGEEAMPKWQAAVEAFPPLLERMNDMTIAATEDLAESDRRGKGFGGRLAVLRRYAADLRPIADVAYDTGQQYASELVQVDPAILTMIRTVAEGAEAGTLSDEDRQAAQAFFGAMRQLSDASGATAGSLNDLVRTIGANTSASKDLRPVLRKMQDGLRHVLDAQAIIDEWRRRIEETGSSFT